MKLSYIKKKNDVHEDIFEKTMVASKWKKKKPKCVCQKSTNKTRNTKKFLERSLSKTKQGIKNKKILFETVVSIKKNT